MERVREYRPHPEQIKWKPDRGSGAAAYWIIKSEWDRCVKIGPPAISPLIRALQADNDKVRLGAAQALGEIGDGQAVEPLISLLVYRSRTDEAERRKTGYTIRRAAAESLLKLYTANKLDDDHKKLVLAQRETITEDHADGFEHDDTPHVDYSDYSTGGSGYSRSSHADSGIGIDFPL